MVCKPKEHEGLGLKDCRLFNMALLGKWNWRFLTGPFNLWSRVVKAQNDTCGESPWWMDVRSICMMDGWNWFEAGLQKTVLDGCDTNFCDENGLGLGLLRSRFQRLYNLSWQKRESVKSMGSWRSGEWNWDFRWRRILRGRRCFG